MDKRPSATFSRFSVGSAIPRAQVENCRHYVGSWFYACLSRIYHFAQLLLDRLLFVQRAEHSKREYSGQKIYYNFNKIKYVGQIIIFAARIKEECSMPMDFRKFVSEYIEAEGYSIEQTKSGHYWVITPSGGKLITFAVLHGKNTKGGEVLDKYVSRVRNNIKWDKERSESFQISS